MGGVHPAGQVSPRLTGEHHDGRLFSSAARKYNVEVLFYGWNVSLGFFCYPRRFFSSELNYMIFFTGHEFIFKYNVIDNRYRLK